MVYLLIAWWIFPWQTVSHNQMVNMSFTARNLPERHHHWTHSDWLSSPPHIWPPDVGEPLPGVILKYVNRYIACLMDNRYYIYCVYIYILGMSIYRVCIYMYVCMYYIYTHISYIYIVILKERDNDWTYGYVSKPWCGPLRTSTNLWVFDLAPTAIWTNGFRQFAWDCLKIWNPHSIPHGSIMFVPSNA